MARDPLLVRVETLFEAAGLPLVYVGDPERIGSSCPLCGAGMCVEFRPAGVGLLCTAECAEREIWAAVGGVA